MIRELPVATDRLALLSTGDVEPITKWVDDPTTGRRKPSDEVERDEATNLPLWRVHVLVPGGDNGRPELVAVQVPAPTKPEVTPFSPVQFERLVCRVAVNRQSNQLAGYWSAAGVAAPARNGHKPAEQAA